MASLFNLFLRILNIEPDNIDGQQRATYILTRDSATTAVQGTKTTFSLAVQSITDSQFDVFGQAASGEQTKNTIRTFVRISGLQSGAVKEFSVEISRTG